MALYLLDMHRAMESDARKDPVKVSRAITEMVSHEILFCVNFCQLNCSSV